MYSIKWMSDTFDHNCSLDLVWEGTGDTKSPRSERCVSTHRNVIGLVCVVHD